MSKQSHGEASVMLDLWGMHSTPSLSSRSGLLCTGVVAPDRVLSMGQIKKLYLYQMELFETFIKIT